MTPMTYIAASADLPMQDKNLMALDQALGLDWMGYFNFFYHHYALLYAAVVGYSMIGWPVFGVPIVLAVTRHYRRLQEFTLAFALALIATTAVSTSTPAMGTYDWLHYLPNPDIFTPGAYLEQLRDLPLVRDGSLRHLELTKLAGIVTFPSFHSAAAVLYLWAFWPVRWMRPIAVVANVGMLVATPVCEQALFCRRLCRHRDRRRRHHGGAPDRRLARKRLSGCPELRAARSDLSGVNKWRQYCDVAIEVRTQSKTRRQNQAWLRKANHFFLRRC